MAKITKLLLLVLIALTTIPLSGCGRVEKAEETPENITKTEINCEAPCANYVDKCLTLVPGATQQLYVDGQTSCVKECKDWDTKKTKCILDAENCTLMTDECKL